MKYHKFDPMSLRLFIAAAELGSFKSAADAVHIVPSAASRRLSEMEAEIGARLFHRHANGVSLTEAGVLLQRYASIILTSYDKLYLECSEISAGIKGLIRIWASSSSLSERFAGVLSSFLETNQDIKIELEERTDGEIVEAIRDNRTDVGVFSSHQRVTGLQTFPFSSDRIVAVLPNSHPLAGAERLSFEAISQYDIIGWNDGIALGRVMTDYGSAVGAPLRIRLKVKSFGAMCNLIKANLGIGLAPHPQVDAEVKRHGLTITPILTEWASRNVLFGYRDAEALGTAGRLLIDYVQRVVPQPLQSNTVL